MASFEDLFNIKRFLDAGASWIYNFFESPAKNQQINEYLALHPMEARVKDLENAGLSPTLASGMGASPPIHMTNTNGASNPASLLATLFQMRETMANVGKIHADISNGNKLASANETKILAEAKAADSLADKNDADAELARIQAQYYGPMSDAKIAQLLAEAGLTNAAMEKIPAEVKEINARAEVAISEVSANESRIKLQDAQTGKVLADELVSNETVAKLKAETNHIIKSDSLLDAQVSKLNVEEKELLYNMVVAMYTQVKTNDSIDKDIWSKVGFNRLTKWMQGIMDEQSEGGSAFQKLFHAIQALVRKETE